MRKSETRGAELPFLVVYDRFREMLALNESIHQLMADLEERIAGRRPPAPAVAAQKMRQGFLDALIMVKDLNQISGGRYAELYAALEGLNRSFESAAGPEARPSADRIVIPLSGLRAADAAAAGVKMAHLGEVRNALGLPVPDGFAVTTGAFRLFMSENGLWERAHQLSRMATGDPAALDAAGREVREAVLRAPVPASLEEEILSAFDRLASGGPLKVAVRSSAVGEDLAASHAGQYYTELNVGREGLLDAYRMVLASAYRPEVIVYRSLRGLTEADASMAVGCLRMVEPRCGGVLFSRDFREPGADRIEVGFVRGLADKLVQGERDAELRVLGREDLARAADGGLRAGEPERLFETARRLEAHFGRPQDIEWAIDAAGQLIFLQARQMVEIRPTGKLAAPPPGGAEPILAGGQTACPGAGAGAVAIIRDPSALEGFPAGAVAVAPHASPLFSRIMARAAAIVTEVGSPTGHMGILAREFGVPAIVGLAGAAQKLQSGQVITVDASACRIYAGALEIEKPPEEKGPPPSDAPGLEKVRQMARLVTPLHLIDPAAPEFRPAGCRSLHDLTRFVHEKLYGEMFLFGDRASKGLKRSFVLEADLPLEVRVFDVGGGVRPGAGRKGRLRPEEIASAPFKAVLDGLCDPRIDWRKPRAVSAGGFLSVVGESLLGPPAESVDLGSASFAVVSDRYANLSVKAGYHFSTIDAFGGEDPRLNYISFRFVGGGAGPERRWRRLGFLSEVLGRLGFELRAAGDLLVARLEKLDLEPLLGKLRDLGRLTLCSRQLDMLMESDASPGLFAEAFLRGEWEKF